MITYTLMKNKVCGIISLVLVVLQLVLVMASWIMTAAMPELPMRSLLSAEGIRWFFGHFAENINSQVLVSIVLLAVAIGAVMFSGVAESLSGIVFHRKTRYMERVALWAVAIELAIAAIVVILLTSVPHAILLSVTGHLFPSSFSQSLIPIVSVTLLICSLSFGIVSGKLSSMGLVYETMTYGLVCYAWLIPIYIFAIELYRSVLFVFPSLST